MLLSVHFQQQSRMLAKEYHFSVMPCCCTVILSCFSVKQPVDGLLVGGSDAATQNVKQATFMSQMHGCPYRIQLEAAAGAG